MKAFAWLAGVALTLIAGLGGSGCGSERAASPPAVADPTGGVVAHSPCGGFTAALNEIDPPSSQDYIEYDYDGSTTLMLRHWNAGLNCCPGGFDIRTHVEDGVITVDERHVAQLCRCLCLFDVDLQLHDVPPGVYRIQVLEQCLYQGDEPLVFTVDLTGPRTGSYCIERTHYPWDNWQ